MSRQRVGGRGFKAKVEDNTFPCEPQIVVTFEGGLRFSGMTVVCDFLGNSPHPSVPEEEDSQSELLIAEDKMSPEQEAHLMPR